MVTRKVVEIIGQENGHRIVDINFIIDIGSGKVTELISYNQLLEHLETDQDKVTEVCHPSTLLEVSWQMCHDWITYGTVTRTCLMVSRLHYKWNHLI